MASFDCYIQMQSNPRNARCSRLSLPRGVRSGNRRFRSTPRQLQKPSYMRGWRPYSARGAPHKRAVFIKAHSGAIPGSCEVIPFARRKIPCCCSAHAARPINFKRQFPRRIIPKREHRWCLSWCCHFPWEWSNRRMSCSSPICSSCRCESAIRSHYSLH